MTKTRSRAFVVALSVISGATTAGSSLLRGLLATASRMDGAEAAVLLVSHALLLAALIWVCLASLAVVAEVWRGQVGQAGPAVPLLVRRGVLAACGVALIGSVAAGPAHAEDDVRREALHGLQMPTRLAAEPDSATLPPHPGPAMSVRSVEAAALKAAPKAAPKAEHLVQSGESLWTIAAAGLPSRASDDAISARWRAIWHLNSAALGSDPDHIVPGQLLRLPPPVRTEGTS